MRTVETPNIVIIKPKIFACYPEISCGISTRKGGVSPEPFAMNLSYTVGDEHSNVMANRERFFGSLHVPIDRLAVPYQIHSDVVRNVNAPGRHDACDALITNTPELFLAVTVADCIPVLLYDPVTRSVGAVHSGWKGSKSKIVMNAIAEMRNAFKTKPQDLIAYIGPSASVCCYEVGEEVAGEFDPQFVKRRKGSKPYLDLKSLNTSLLLQAGVRATNIEVSEHCAICTLELFHSYRRDGKHSGRMMGVIGILSN
jgi:YfiH family protein